MDTKNIEAQDFDIIESAVVALKEIWKKKLFILLITIAGFLASILVINIQGNTTEYYSSATLFSAVYGSYSDTTEGVVVMNRYASLISSSRVCSRAAQSLAGYGITTEELQSMVSSGVIRVSGASSNSSSYGYRLTVSVYVDSAELAIPLANTMATAFAAELNELIGSNVIQVMDEATRTTAYSTVNTLLYMIVFTGGAFVLACGAIFVLVFFSPWVRSVKQCEQNDDLILGMIPYAKER